MLTGASRLHVALVQEPARSVPEDAAVASTSKATSGISKAMYSMTFITVDLSTPGVFGSGMIPTLAVAR
jgi:hypothetical protein